MKRFLVGVSALAVGAALACATPAASEPVPVVSPDPFVAAMQRDLGLTQAQALTRMRQEATAMAVDPAAAEAAGAAYGGSWFDPARGTLVVGLSSLDNRKAVEATGA